MRFNSSRFLGVVAAMAMSFSSISSAFAQARDYRTAEMEFLRLPIDRRYDVRMLLGVAGYWPAVANDQFNARLFDAIVRFQSDNGMSPTGVLSADQFARLHQIADPLLAAWQFKMVRHPAAGLPLWVPVGVGLTQYATRNGIEFENADKTIAISFIFLPDDGLGDVHFRLSNVRGFHPVYDMTKSDFFALTTESPTATAYSRFHAIPQGVIGFTIKWAKIESLHGERLSTLMSDLFRANVGLHLGRTPPQPNFQSAVALPRAPMPTPAAEPPASPTPPPLAVAPPPQTGAAKPEEKKSEKKDSQGTGFFVSPEGHIVTNAHVVEGCEAVQVAVGLAPKAAGRVMARDSANDLALVKIDAHPATYAAFRSNVRLGEGVAAFGFPFAGLLATSGNFTLGNITATAGLGDDTRLYQISAPVQPGNSGGPLLDQSGNVIGIVESKLNAIIVAVALNDIPQNVNFAIKANVITNFLEAKSVVYSSGALAPVAMQPADLAERAKSMAVVIECRG